MFDGKFDSGRIFWISRKQQDGQSFADGNLQYELDLSYWCVNRTIDTIKKINRSTALVNTREFKTWITTWAIYKSPHLAHIAIRQKLTVLPTSPAKDYYAHRSCIVFNVKLVGSDLPVIQYFLKIAQLNSTFICFQCETDRYTLLTVSRKWNATCQNVTDANKESCSLRTR